MTRLSLRRLVALLFLSALLFSAATPQPAAAQGGNNDVTFWDDSGETSTTADIPAPADFVSEGLSNLVYLNPTGGRDADNNLLVAISNKGVHVIRDRDWQIVNPNSSGGRRAITLGSMAFILYADQGCFYSDVDCFGNNSASRGTLVDDKRWDTETVELLQDGPTTWIARTVESVEWNSRTYTVTSTYTYTPPSPYIDVRATVSVSPSYNGTMHLYLVADMYLDGSDYGPGYGGNVNGDLAVLQTNATAVGGIAEDSRPFDSYFEGNYSCIYGSDPLSSCGNSADHWSSSDSSADSWFGPSLGEPYPSPAIINGSYDGYDPEVDIDAGVGAHWNVTTNRTVETSLIFMSRTDFEDAKLSDLRPGETEDPTDEPTGEPTTTPTVCQQTPDIAVSPQFIDLAPGGRAAVTVSMRNLCNDAPLRSSDLLLSLSDGLRVLSGSDGLVNLGQRAALQGFSLSPNETRSWTFEVEADTTLPTAPIFVVELYQGSSVSTRIDGVFITDPAAVAAPAAPPAPDEPAAPTVPEDPAAPAAAAPLPTALPNTSQTPDLLPFVALLAAVLLSLTVLRLHRRA